MTSLGGSTDVDGVVYDLDGTLVRLQVDWGQVASDVHDVYESAGIEPPSSELWDLMDRADEHGLADSVEEAVASYERAGARAAPELQTAARLRDEDRPVAVCSLNCEAACRIALQTHGLDGDVHAIIGRDTVSEQKPAAEPLLAAFDAIDIAPGAGLFIGDSESDATTAERAGSPFQYVSDLADRV